MPDRGSTFAQVTARFAARFGRPPQVLIRSPGRVNLIGDHTDYNDGYVLPLAIEREVLVAAALRGDRTVLLASGGFPDVSIDLDALDHGGPEWGEYATGVAWSLRLAGVDLVGWDGMVESDVPVGAGLSSSAALELAVARVFTELAAVPWEPEAMAVAARRAENDWVGMACGIMDQLVIAAAPAGAALLIDCRSLETTPVRLPVGVAVVVVDTGTRRSLVGSAYNERRAACERAARSIGVAALRDATVDDLATVGDATTRRRARHVVTENGRVLAMRDALGRADLGTAGRLMTESHASLRDDFEVSTPAVDAVVERISAFPGCFGARITGAGFGGCVVALVASRYVPEILAALAAAAGVREAFVTRPAAGVTAAPAGP
jgi:galactokinase